MDHQATTSDTHLPDCLGVLDAAERAGVAAALERSYDRAYADAAIGQIMRSCPDVAREVLGSEIGRSNFLALAAVSRSIVAWLSAHEGELSRLRDPHFAGPMPDRGALISDAVATVASAEDPEASLRIFKHRHFTRIALRDLLKLTTLREVGRCLAELADAVLEGALYIASDGDTGQLAVIAMGKLGGRELNYSSDVDVMLISSGVGGELDTARRLLEVMEGPQTEGIAWRIDMDLRPEGKSGPLSRSLEAYLRYYRRWAQAWEFQALIKRRVCAGNLELGAEFVATTEDLVYPVTLPAGRVNEIRTMKARAESQVSRAGLADRQVKLGPGGIRDVEFAVQLLQLVHGRTDQSIRSANTLTALQELASAGYVAQRDGEILANSYIKLRTVEHRLQLENEAQIHTLPRDPVKLDHLARSLGYRPTRSETPTEQFQRTFVQDMKTVRSVHQRLFYRPLLEAFAGEATTPISTDAAHDRLRAFGFYDAGATLRALRELTSGLSRRSKLMEATLPLVLEWLGDTPNPNLGLLMLGRLTSDPHRLDTVAAVFRESPLAARRLCKALGTSRLIGESLERFPEMIQILGDDEALTKPRRHADLANSAERQLAMRRSSETRIRSIRNFVHRERLRIALRDVLGFCDADEACKELSDVADVSLDATLATFSHDTEHVPAISFIGLGSLGARELTYVSDLDFVVVYDDRGTQSGHGSRAAVDEAVHYVLESLGTLSENGKAFEIDLDLRPEGKQGQLARSIAGYVSYWERWAQTWELQALTRARHVAGDAALSDEFISEASRFVYVSPFPEKRAIEIGKMKARIDRERMPRRSDRNFHLKLGRGGINEVEFAVQLLQLRYGGDDESVRSPSTLDALAALRDSGHIDPASATRLAAAYRFVRVLRNRLMLLGARDPNELPTNLDELSNLARSLGYNRYPAPTLREEYRRVTRRAAKTADAILYPQR